MDNAVDDYVLSGSTLRGSGFGGYGYGAHRTREAYNGTVAVAKIEANADLIQANADRFDHPEPVSSKYAIEEVNTEEYKG